MPWGSNLVKVNSSTKSFKGTPACNAFDTTLAKHFMTIFMVEPSLKMSISTSAKEPSANSLVRTTTSCPPTVASCTKPERREGSFKTCAVSWCSCAGPTVSSTSSTMSTVLDKGCESLQPSLYNAIALFMSFHAVKYASWTSLIVQDSGMLMVLHNQG